MICLARINAAKVQKNQMSDTQLYEIEAYRPFQRKIVYRLFGEEICIKYSDNVC